MENCIFCKIGKKEIEAAVVYEDNKIISFMDANPVSQGHTLVIPKSHYENIFDITEDEIGYLQKMVKRIANAVKKAVNAEGISIIQNNGRAAGQIIFHFHTHIIPKSSSDSIGSRAAASKEELKAVAEKIRQFISLNKN